MANIRTSQNTEASGILLQARTACRSQYLEQLEVLNEAALLAHTLDSDRALHLLKAKLVHFDPRLDWLRSCVMTMACQNSIIRKRTAAPFTEFDVHKEFWDNLSEYVPGAERIKKSGDGVNTPDGWILLDGEEIPVEVKRSNFNKKSGLQLARYMRAYGSKKGIAVSIKFTSEFDDSIIRVPCRPPKAKC